MMIVYVGISGYRVWQVGVHGNEELCTFGDWTTKQCRAAGVRPMGFDGGSNLTQGLKVSMAVFTIPW